MITSLSGTRACPLGLAAYAHQDVRCIRRAFRRGINYFFFYGPGDKDFIRGLAPLFRAHRDEMIIATGSGSRHSVGLRAARKRILAVLGEEMIDAFFIEYIHEADDPAAIFGAGGVFDELQRWKSEGWIRFVGATTHNRNLAKQLAADPRVDLLMHRFNMAHRKAVREVFPTAIRTRTPIVAFTATRWGTLLESRADWRGSPPRASDCYRYCLAHPAVHLVLTAPRSIAELDTNLETLALPRMSLRDRTRWERFGDLVHERGSSDFETQWP